MSDAGIRQKTFQILLRQRHQVANKHRGRGQYRKDQLPLFPAFCSGDKSFRDKPQNQSKGRRFGPNGQIGCHRVGRTFVYIRCPHMERHGRNLEHQAN